MGSMPSGESLLEQIQDRIRYLEALVLYGAASVFSVKNSGFSFTIDGYAGSNPPILVLCGLTYAFDLGLEPNHPFVIRNAIGGGLINSNMTFVDGLGNITKGSSANVGRTTGRLYWHVPHTLPTGTYVYQSMNYDSMAGNIVIRNMS
jgi:hypothetical protein